MAYIDCDKCSHGCVCAYRHQYDDHIVTCNHWKPADDKAEIERLEVELKAMRGAANSYKAENGELRKGLNIWTDIARRETQYCEQARSEAIKEFAERLCDGRVSNDPVVIAAEALLKEMTEDNP